MIVFNYEIDYELAHAKKAERWIQKCIEKYGFKEGEINYIFCDDSYLLKLNVKYLNHNTLTDIISFDYTIGKLLSGDIFISVERVRENAIKYNQTFDNEINRVLIHGVLHFMGYMDKTKESQLKMRAEEDSCLKLFN